VWAVGCTLEGQCGLGTPIEELARQHRRAHYNAVQLEALLRNRPSASGSGGSARHEAFLRSYADAHWGASEGERQRQQMVQRRGFGGRQSLSSAWAMRAPGGGGGRAGAALSSSGGLGGAWEGVGGGGGGGSAMGITPSGIWGVDLELHLQETGLQPGIVHTPTRIERPLFDARGLGGAGASQGSTTTTTTTSSSSSSSISDSNSSISDSSSSSSSSGGGLEQQRVVGVDCSRYFSIAVTDSGEVWTWGASYTGALGQEGVSWSTSARRIGGPVAEAVRGEGGAVAVAAAGTGAACITARWVRWVVGRVSLQEGRACVSQLQEPPCAHYKASPSRVHLHAHS